MSEQKKELRSDEIEKLRIKYSFFKFLLGTFAISLLSIIINWQIQEKRLQFEIQTKESDYIAQFLEHGLRKELEQRLDFAAYFVRLSPSDESRARWKSYLDFVEELISIANKKEKIIAEKDLRFVAAIEQIEELQLEAERARAKINKLEKLAKNDENMIQDELSKLRAKAEQASAEAKRLSQNLEQLQKQLVNERAELASLRSKPLNIEGFTSQAAQQIQAVPTKRLGWAYLGHYESDKGVWKTRYFDFMDESRPNELQGAILSVRNETGSVNVRNSPPNSYGSFGDVVSHLRPNQKVRVLEVREWSSSGYIWARVASLGGE